MDSIESLEAWIGHTIADRYQLDEVLGIGGMAMVFRATHVITQRAIALKMIPCMRPDRVALARFGIEASAPARIGHPNLVEIHDAGYDAQAGCFYVAQELLSGRSLEAELTARGSLPWQEALELLEPVARALDAAHRAGFVHRDVKASNVFLARKQDGTLVPKLLDFGIARVAEDPRLTATGVVMGSVYTFAPEQAAGDGVDARADQWSWACTFFECVSGRPVFDGPTHQAVIAQVLTAPVPHLADVTYGIPARVCEAIDRSLERDRQRRWSSMRSMLSALSGTPSLDATLDDLDDGETVQRPRPAIIPPAAPDTPVPPAMPSYGTLPVVPLAGSRLMPPWAVLLTAVTMVTAGGGAAFATCTTHHVAPAARRQVIVPTKAEHIVPPVQMPAPPLSLPATPSEPVPVVAVSAPSEPRPVVHVHRHTTDAGAPTTIAIASRRGAPLLAP